MDFFGKKRKLRKNQAGTLDKLAGLSDGELNELLFYAAKCGDLAMMKAFLRGGADANYQHAGATALCTAAAKGHLEVVTLLLDQGAALDRADRAGKTALYYAAEAGHLEVVRLLLDRGASVMDMSATALHRAADRGHLEVVRLLLDRGAELEASDGDATALQRAAEAGHLELVILLLDRGAALDVWDGYGGETLYYTAEDGHLEVVRLLLRVGAARGHPFALQGDVCPEVAEEIGRLEGDRGAMAMWRRDVQRRVLG